MFLMGYEYHATIEGQDWADVHLYSTDHRSLFQAPPSPFILRLATGRAARCACALVKERVG